MCLSPVELYLCMEGQRHTLLPPTPMSTNATDDVTDATSEDRSQRYAELNIGDEDFVIYDRENHQAWIQSTVALDVGNPQ